jgi:hypothetical protein
VLDHIFNSRSWNFHSTFEVLTALNVNDYGKPYQRVSEYPAPAIFKKTLTWIRRYISTRLYLILEYLKMKEKSCFETFVSMFQTRRRHIMEARHFISLLKCYLTVSLRSDNEIWNKALKIYLASWIWASYHYKLERNSSNHLISAKRDVRSFWTYCFQQNISEEKYIKKFPRIRVLSEKKFN